MTPQEKRRVRSKAQHALTRGQLVKQPCVVCGTKERVEAHHLRGYESPHELDVEWLCRTHHMVLHRKPVATEELLTALQNAGNREEAARVLGVSLSTLQRRMTQHGIKRIYKAA